MQCTTPQHNIITINCTLSVGRQGDCNELLAQVAKRAEQAQLLVIILLIIITNDIEFYTMTFNILVDPPSPPVIIDFPSSQQSSAESVIVTIEWNPPFNNSEANIHNYTVSVSPSTQLSATVVTSTTVNVTAEYNVNYTLSIVATNCAGNSNTAVYLFSVCKFCYFVTYLG